MKHSASVPVRLPWLKVRGPTHINFLLRSEVIDLIVEVQKGFRGEAGHNVIPEDHAVGELPGFLGQAAVHAGWCGKAIHLDVLHGMGGSGISCCCNGPNDSKPAVDCNLEGLIDLRVPVLSAHDNGLM